VLTDYAEKMTGWEEWQHAYRFGLLLIYPPDPVRSQVNLLRARCDPKSAAICDGHISLTVPLPRPLSKSAWQELSSAAGTVRAITIKYGPLSHYLPHPGIVLAIQPQNELDRLRLVLEQTAPFTGAVDRSWPFSAHMTIAEFITVERTNELMEELRDVAPNGQFVCDSVSLAVPDEAFRFEERRKLLLAR
jgi:2'-5' RNA ligase